MARLHAITALICAVALPLALGGCAGALVVGGLAAAGGAGYTAAQERGVDGAVDDFSPRPDVEKTLPLPDPQPQSGATTAVCRGPRLLTRCAPHPQTRPPT